MSDIPVTKIGELLDTVSSKLPTLVTNLLRSLYSEEAGIEMGKAVGGLYKELINSGIPPEVALKMASDYMVNQCQQVKTYGCQRSAIHLAIMMEFRFSG